MTNYYKVLFQEEESLGIGHTVESRDLFFLPDTGTVDGWQPLVLELREGDYPDYLACNLGCRLCSERLKDILQSRASPSDVLEWLEVVVRKQGQERRYFILHFPQAPDVLDKKKTIFAGDFVVKAVLSKDAVAGHQVFAYPKCGCLPLFISEEVSRAIDEEQCTGMEFSKLPVA
jgi:hypothetical protein